MQLAIARGTTRSNRKSRKSNETNLPDANASYEYIVYVYCIRTTSGWFNIYAFRGIDVVLFRCTALSSLILVFRFCIRKWCAPFDNGKIKYELEWHRNLKRRMSNGEITKCLTFFLNREREREKSSLPIGNRRSDGRRRPRRLWRKRRKKKTMLHWNVSESLTSFFSRLNRIYWNSLYSSLKLRLCASRTFIFSCYFV